MNLTTDNECGPETMPAERSFVVPRVDITETAEAYHLEADMPGVSRENLELLLEGNELTLVGRRTRVTDDASLLHGESAALDYRRTFVLDPVIDTNGITAQLEQGLLALRLPKAEKVKPRRIAVVD